MSTEIQDMIIESVDKILKDKCTKDLVDKSEKGDWAEELWNLLEEASITAIGVPSTLEDLGGDFRLAFHVLKTVGKYAVPLPLAETYLANWIGNKFASIDVADRLTLKINRNDVLTLNDNKISGEIANVPWARIANYLLTLAEENDEYYLCLVPLANAEIVENSNLAGEYNDKVIFNNVEVDSSLYKKVDVTEVTSYALKLGALSKAALIAGAMEETLDQSVSYSIEREQFGIPLHRLQAIQHMLAQLAGQAVAINAAADSAINSLDNENFNMLVSIAKLRSSKLANDIAKTAHQLHGAIGVTYEHRLHQLTRRLWAWREEYGNEVFWRNELSKLLLAANDTSLWNIVTK